MKVQIKILDQRLHELMPRYATHGAAAFDVVACIAENFLTLEPGDHERVGLGFEIAIPPGYMGVLAPRSSKGEQGLVLANTVGIIDSDYRGKVKAGDTLNVAVDKDYYYQPMQSCPRGRKVTLLTCYGVAIQGQYDGKDPQFVGWAALPKIPPWMKRLMK